MYEYIQIFTNMYKYVQMYEYIQIFGIWDIRHAQTYEYIQIFGHGDIWDIWDIWDRGHLGFGFIWVIFMGYGIIHGN